MDFLTLLYVWNEPSLNHLKWSTTYNISQTSVTGNATHRSSKDTTSNTWKQENDMYLYLDVIETIYYAKLISWMIIFWRLWYQTEASKTVIIELPFLYFTSSTSASLLYLITVQHPGTVNVIFIVVLYIADRLEVMPYVIKHTRDPSFGFGAFVRVMLNPLAVGSRDKSLADVCGQRGRIFIGYLWRYGTAVVTLAVIPVM